MLNLKNVSKVYATEDIKVMALNNVLLPTFGKPIIPRFIYLPSFRFTYSVLCDIMQK